MGGILGRLLEEFAIVIAVAVLVSGFISLSLTPMLCSRFLKPHREIKRGRLFELSERAFQAMLHLYERTLKVSLRHHAVVFLIALGTVAATAWMTMALPKGFVPNEDTGQIFAMTEAAQGVSFEKMGELQQQAAAIVLENPHVGAFMSSIGVGGPNATANTGRLFMNLKPRSQRPPADAIIADLRAKFAEIPGLRVFPQVLPTIRIGGTLTKSLYQFTLAGPNLEELYAVAPKVEAKMRQIPGLIDVTSDLQMTNPQVLVTIDRDKASSLGVSASQVQTALSNAYSSRQVSTIYTPTNQYQVIVEVLPQYQQSSVDLSTLYLRSTTGRLVPLSAVTQIGQSTGPLTVQHLGQLPAVTLSFNLAKGSRLGRGHRQH